MPHDREPGFPPRDRRNDAPYLDEEKMKFPHVIGELGCKRYFFSRAIASGGELAAPNALSGVWDGQHQRDVDIWISQIIAVHVFCRRRTSGAGLPLFKRNRKGFRSVIFEMDSGAGQLNF
jgi:hypothetical protein